MNFTSVFTAYHYRLKALSCLGGLACFWISSVWSSGPPLLPTIIMAEALSVNAAQDSCRAMLPFSNDNPPIKTKQPADAGTLQESADKKKKMDLHDHDGPFYLNIIDLEYLSKLGVEMV